MKNKGMVHFPPEQAVTHQIVADEGLSSLLELPYGQAHLLQKVNHNRVVRVR